MNPCTLCPGKCRVYRGKGRIVFRGIGDMPIISCVGPHFGEEDVPAGKGGSGTIFFAGGHFRAGIEGLTIYYAPDGEGYLIVSDQTSS